MADIFRVRAKGTTDADGRAVIPVDFSRYLIGARGIVTRLIASVAETGGALARDEFERTVANPSWGTADVGGTWVVEVNTSTWQITCNGSRGVIDNGGAGNTRALMSLPVNIFDGEQLFLVCQAVGGFGGGTATVQNCLRITDAANYYALEFSWNDVGGSGARLRIIRRVAGIDTALATAFFPVAGPIDDPYWMKFSVIGTNLQGTIWPLGTTEPSTPSLTATDATLAGPGDSGVGIGPNAAPAGSTTRITVDSLVVAAGAAVAVVLPSWKAFIGDVNDPSNLVDSSQGAAIPSWVPSLVNGQPVFQGDVLSLVAEGAAVGSELVVSCYLAAEKI